MTTVPFRDPSLFQSKGQREHQDTPYVAEMVGQDWQGLLTFLESQAENSQHFPEIAQITSWVITLRLSLKSHGW